jgi:hypothetical protein
VAWQNFKLHEAGAIVRFDILDVVEYWLVERWRYVKHKSPWPSQREQLSLTDSVDLHLFS